MTRALRYEIPVDGSAHLRVLPGPALHVAARRPDVVELWCQDNGEARAVKLYVVGTGHPWPTPATHLGTTPAPGDLVWHLLALEPSSTNDATLHCGQSVGPEDHLVLVTRDDSNIHPAQLQNMAQRLPAALHGRVVIIAGSTFDAHVIAGPVCIDCGDTIAPGTEWTVYDAGTGLATRGLCPRCGQQRVARHTPPPGEQR